MKVLSLAATLAARPISDARATPPTPGRADVERAEGAGDCGEAIAFANACHFDVAIPTTTAWRGADDVVAQEIVRLR